MGYKIERSGKQETTIDPVLSETNIAEMWFKPKITELKLNSGLKGFDENSERIRDDIIVIKLGFKIPYVTKDQNYETFVKLMKESEQSFIFTVKS